MKKRKIAIIAPPFELVSKKKQRGTERIVYQSAIGLQNIGYDVTVFGAGKCNSITNFVPLLEKAVDKINPKENIEASRKLRMESLYISRVGREITKRDKEFDIIFNHMRGGFSLLPLSEFLKTPIVHILHLPIFKELESFLSLYKKPNIVTISNSQRKGFKKINYLATLYNGVSLEEFPFKEKAKDYFLFLGALGEHKNPKDAIIAAKKAKVNLLIASGKVREPYYSKEIKPLIDDKIKYIGEASDKKRVELFKNAKGLLFPIKWREPFGLVMIEAMACGTPVIAYPNGAVEEIVEDKKTGFIVKNRSEMVKAIKNIDKIKREDCRERVKKHFTIEEMVKRYDSIIKNHGR